jgi:hypothetical protein
MLVALKQHECLLCDTNEKRVVQGAKTIHQYVCLHTKVGVHQRHNVVTKVHAKEKYDGIDWYQ